MFDIDKKIIISYIINTSILKWYSELVQYRAKLCVNDDLIYVLK